MLKFRQRDLFAFHCLHTSLELEGEDTGMGVGGRWWVVVAIVATKNFCANAQHNLVLLVP